MSGTNQTRLPNWYPDPDDPALVRWWDGLDWTTTVRPGDAPDQSATPRAAPVRPDTPPRHRVPAHTPLIAGLLFFVSSVLAMLQTVFILAMPQVGGGRAIPVTLPFDWYLVLFPYLIPGVQSLVWGLLPPIIVLTSCTIVALTLGRRRTTIAMITIAALLTVQNLLLLIPIFIDAGIPEASGIPIFMPTVFSDVNMLGVLVGVVVLHVVVWLIPLLFAATTIGGARTREFLTRAFLAAESVFMLGALGVFLFTHNTTSYLLRPGSPDHAGSWLSILSTALCLGALTLFVLPRRPSTQGRKTPSGMTDTPSGRV
ncbi:MAG: DUF2510 domain-containing protein [Propionibacteriaceae bacterium]|jgi:hypothetical protein|nr:DUF2510 domain-containing protein [Propionibacteriaceae bacterium]